MLKIFDVCSCSGANLDVDSDEEVRHCKQKRKPGMEVEDDDGLDSVQNDLNP